VRVMGLWMGADLGVWKDHNSEKRSETIPTDGPSPRGQWTGSVLLVTIQPEINHKY